MLLRLIILTSVALFVAMSLANRVDRVARVVAPDRLHVVETVAAGSAFATPLEVGPDGKIIANIRPDSAAIPAALQDNISAALSEAQTLEPGLPVQYVTAARVNMRAGPGTENPVVGQIVFAEAVSVVTVLANGWAEVRIEGDGGTGFVAARFLADAPPQ